MEETAARVARHDLVGCGGWGWGWGGERREGRRVASWFFFVWSSRFDALGLDDDETSEEPWPRPAGLGLRSFFPLFFSPSAKKRRERVRVLPLALALLLSPTRTTSVMPLPCMSAPPRPSVSVPGARRQKKDEFERRNQRRANGFSWCTPLCRSLSLSPSSSSGSLPRRLLSIEE